MGLFPVSKINKSDVNFAVSSNGDFDKLNHLPRLNDTVGKTEEVAEPVEDTKQEKKQKLFESLTINSEQMTQWVGCSYKE